PGGRFRAAWPAWRHERASGGGYRAEQRAGPSSPEVEQPPQAPGAGSMTGRNGHGRTTVVVAGNGMVGHKVVETLLERDTERRYDIVVFGEEPRFAYDRVGLSSFFSGVSAEELSLVAPDAYTGVDVRLGDPIAAID